MPPSALVESGRVPGDIPADVVVVGGGTVGAWCAVFLRRSGLHRVVLLEAASLGQGASSRAAGIVRSQGGTPTAVRLAEWSRRFYCAQYEEAGFDSGFVRQGYYLPCFTEADIVDGACTPGHAAGARPAGPLDRRRRGRGPQPHVGHGSHARRHLPRRRRLHPPAAQRPGLFDRTRGLGSRGLRAHLVRRPVHIGRPGDRRRDQPGQGADGRSRVDRGPPARRGRPTRRHPDPGWRRSSSGCRHRAASRAGPVTRPDGVRRRGRPLLATRGGRLALRDEQPGGTRRRRHGDRLAVPRRDAGPPGVAWSR